jgi:hypothetical protein
MSKPKTPANRYEIIEATRLKHKTRVEHDAAYAECLAVCEGNSGRIDEGNGIFEIKTFAPSVKKLEKEGFKNMHFPNGGDDDVLVVDHKTKKFGFFEDYVPTKLRKDPSYSGGSLQSLWNDYALDR